MYLLIEGIDGVGKSTQIQKLKQKDNTILTTREPSGIFRDILLNQKLGMHSELLLFLADRANHYEKVIQPNSDRIVVSDRGFISGIAYAKANNEAFDTQWLIELNRFALYEHLPQKIVLLQIDEATLQKRLSRELDEIEKRGIAYLLTVQRYMKEIIDSLSIESKIIDATLDKETIHQTIYHFLRQKKPL